MPALNNVMTGVSSMTACQLLALVIVMLLSIAGIGLVFLMKRSSDEVDSATAGYTGNMHATGYGNTELSSAPPSYEYATASFSKIQDPYQNTSKFTPYDSKPTKPTKPPFFVLVGDSTTRAQEAGGGGWGSGFLACLARGAEGSNEGINGATTKGYLGSGLWTQVLEKIREQAVHRSVFVTIQFGHNDQIPSLGISIGQYKANLVRMAEDVLTAGGIPLLVTPLSRRDFSLPDHDQVVDNLGEQREATEAAFTEVVSQHKHARARLIDLNTASQAYIGALGFDDAQKYNYPGPGSIDTTHLSVRGGGVFGRMVADLILGHPPKLVAPGERDSWVPGKSGSDDDWLSAFIQPDPFLTGLIWHGKFA